MQSSDNFFVKICKDLSIFALNNANIFMFRFFNSMIVVRQL